MKRKAVPIVLAIFFLGIFVAGISAFAEEIKARMKNRLPVINELKTKGIVGEDNKGFLQFVGAKKEKQDVVSAENNDRLTIYKAIAKQQGATAELVGQRRANQIARKARTGDWLQDDKGKWYQKGK